MDRGPVGHRLEPVGFAAADSRTGYGELDSLTGRTAGCLPPGRLIADGGMHVQPRQDCLASYIDLAS